MTRCAPGMTRSAMSRAGGASMTQGEVNWKSKYTAPVRRTARSTSDKTSTFTVSCDEGDARANAPDARADRRRSRTMCKKNATVAHGVCREWTAKLPEGGGRCGGPEHERIVYDDHHDR